MYFLGTGALSTLAGTGGSQGTWTLRLIDLGADAAAAK